MVHLSQSTTEASDEILHVKKKVHGSVVWKWFSFWRDDTQQSIVLCKLFQASISAKGSNMTILLHDLKHHPMLFAQSVKCSEQGQTSSKGKSLLDIYYLGIQYAVVLVLQINTYMLVALLRFSLYCIISYITISYKHIKI